MSNSKQQGRPYQTGKFNTREELRKAIFERVQTKHSNTHIGKHTGVSRETVRRIRQDLFEQHY